MRVGDRVVLTYLKLDPAKAQYRIDADRAVYPADGMVSESSAACFNGWSIHRLVFPRGAKGFNA
jgi:hypothetical protein